MLQVMNHFLKLLYYENLIFEILFNSDKGDRYY